MSQRVLLRALDAFSAPGVGWPTHSSRRARSGQGRWPSGPRLAHRPHAAGVVRTTPRAARRARSVQAAMPTNIAPRPIACGSAGASPCMNCGRNAAKNSVVLGFSKATSRPFAEQARHRHRDQRGTRRGQRRRRTQHAHAEPHQVRRASELDQRERERRHREQRREADRRAHRVEEVATSHAGDRTDTRRTPLRQRARDDVEHARPGRHGEHEARQQEGHERGAAHDSGPPQALYTDALRRSSVNGKFGLRSSFGTLIGPGVWPVRKKRARRRASASSALIGKVS